MATVQTRFFLNGAALDAMLNGPNGPVAQELQRKGRIIEDRMKATAPVETGNMRSHIRSALVVDTGELEVKVGIFGRSARSVPYIKYVIGGTRTPIRPRRARVLRFVINGRVVYAKEVRGQQANNFMTEAISAAAD